MKPSSRFYSPRVLVPIGAICLTMTIAFTELVHPTARFSESLLDGARGVFFGVSIGFLFLAAVVASRQRRNTTR